MSCPFSRMPRITSSPHHDAQNFAHFSYIKPFPLVINCALQLINCALQLGSYRALILPQIVIRPKVMK